MLIVENLARKEIINIESITHNYTKRLIFGIFVSAFFFSLHNFVSVKDKFEY